MRVVFATTVDLGRDNVRTTLARNAQRSHDMSTFVGVLRLIQPHDLELSECPDGGQLEWSCVTDGIAYLWKHQHMPSNAEDETLACLKNHTHRPDPDGERDDCPRFDRLAAILSRQVTISLEGEMRMGVGRTYMIIEGLVEGRLGFIVGDSVRGTKSSCAVCVGRHHSTWFSHVITGTPTHEPRNLKMLASWSSPSSFPSMVGKLR